MNGLSILMFIFGFLILLCGIYLYSGHNGDFTQLLLWKTHKKSYSTKELHSVGKWTMIASIIPIIIGILALIFDYY